MAHGVAVQGRAGHVRQMHQHVGAMASLLAEFNAYLDRGGANPPADAGGYKQGVLWLDDAEALELDEEIVAAIRRRASNGPGGDRRPRLLSLIAFPTET